MSIAFSCAVNGRGAVEPNPMVGAVLARDGRKLASAWHRRFGGPHAEVEVINAARAAGIDTQGATLYVNLEPCCHFGKTPPCTEAIISSGISRVVSAMVDPDERMAGQGHKRLAEAGVAVTVGVLERQARSLLAPYLKLRTRRRPWVICKWAQTADGYLSLPPSQGRWIAGEQARKKVHELRGLCDGILVGIGTVLLDNPLLTNRIGAGRQPVRVILDSRLRIPAGCDLIKTANFSRVCVVTAPVVRDPARRAYAEHLRLCGVEVLEVPASGGGVNLGQMLDELGRRQWTYLLVEGGPGVFKSFVGEGLVDELWAFVNPRKVRGEQTSLARFDIADLLAGGAWKAEDSAKLEQDSLTRYRQTPQTA
ncbi:MAG: bifunctional diaminohydroxyphosphoribosylaminopyrimidine deaminase/5-amino-6-(5-phosphoribosylamino)uracil reductase RibD [Planctomycetes bacterium]|nr:bifunctional diaminohydroxyphosphoribosylaminopyrimidine deaminase/5-amino-6-(5-phosphoribosylamino)uracil reductase RibD [Planctomycetota bacterium]